MRYTRILPVALAASLVLAGAGSAFAAVGPYGMMPSADGLSPVQDYRLVHALNWLEAAGYRNFGTVTQVGADFQIVATINGAPTTVVVNPETGQINGAVPLGNL